MKTGTKLLCIDMSNPKRPDKLVPEHFLVEGAVYTLHSTYFDHTDGHQYYYIMEKMHIKPVCSYRAYRFIPLDGAEAQVEVVVNEVKEPCLAPCQP